MTVEERASALVGCRFRPQGRSADYGLDCLGLIAIVYRLPVGHVPADYRLRGDHLGALSKGLAPYFRLISTHGIRSGDLLVCEAGREQLHLAVKTTAGFVHADVRRGVVETPGDPRWTVVRVYRRRRKR